MTTEMIEFRKAVERLWATYDSCQKQYDEDETVNARLFDLNRYHRKEYWRPDNKYFQELCAVRENEEFDPE